MAGVNDMVLLVVSLRRFLAVALLLLLNACETPIEVDYDTGHDFSHLRDYAWRVDEQPAKQDPVLYNALTDKRVRQSADTVLAARGFQRVDPASADFLITYHLGIEKKLDTSRVGFGVGYGWSHSSAMMGDGLDIDQYEEESLLIDVLDGRTRELLWRGGIREPLDRYLTAQERTAHIHKWVVDILMKFPPR